MRLFVVRHAKAFDRDPGRFPDDRLRPLTRAGLKAFRTIARSVGSAAEAPEGVLSSSWTRAWDTAVALEDEAGWPAPERCAALESDESGAVAAIAREIATRSKLESLALVGHEPVLGALIAWLLGSDHPIVRMRKGAVAALELASPRQLGAGGVSGAAQLEWLAVPALTRRA
jgi:phosphohistidine phosphatase SixA